MRQRLIDGIRTEILRGLSPHRLALAVACGAACAFFPLLGLATPLCLLVGLMFRLNHPVIQAVNAVTAPLYPFVVLGLFKTGQWIGGSQAHAPGSALKATVYFITHALMGWLVFAALAVPLVYWICRAVTARFWRGPDLKRAPANGPVLP